jgi:histidinol-phosphate aminotransferase
LERFQLTNAAIEEAVAMRPRRVRRTGLNLASNELHHPRLAGVVRELLATVADEETRLYPPYLETLDAIGAYLQRPAAEVLLLPGSDAGVRILCSALTLTGGATRILLQSPNYEGWTGNVFAPALRITPIASATGDSRGSFEALLVAVERVPGSVVVISWPNGPAGYTFSPEELDVLQDRVRSAGSLLVVDGAYAAFTEHPTRLAARAGTGTMVLLSFSKSHGLAGARVATLIADRTAIDYLRRWAPEEHVSGISQAVLRGALTRDEEFRAMWDDVRTNRTWLFERLDRRGLRPLSSGGNFLNFRLPQGESVPAFVSQLEGRGYVIRDTSRHPGLSGCARATVAGGLQDMRGLVHAIDEIRRPP